MLAPTPIAPRITLEDFRKLPETKPASEYLEGDSLPQNNRLIN
jgi:hypothetical protein